MDLVTQGLLGATLAQTPAPRGEIRVASLAGFAAGMLADADTLIRSADDPLLTLDYHRHFTHALLFIPIGALVASALLFPFLRKRLGFRRLYLYCFLGYCLSGLLDACTSYGTHLFWPFLDARVALNLVSVVDPIFSGVLLFACALAFVKRRSTFARPALALGCTYLLLSFWQQTRAGEIARDLAAERGHEIERLVVKPSFGNIVLWRSVYESSGHIYVDAIRAGIDSRVYPGEALRRLRPEDLRLPSDSVLADDVRRFEKFSDGYIGMHAALPGVLGDIRYSMSPTSALPLWGIVVDARKAERHAEFRTFRDFSRRDRQRFVGMLRGD